MTSAPNADGGPSVRVEGGFAVIRVPLAEIHGLRVALAPCPCAAPKSIETAGIRARLERALGRLPYRIGSP